MIILDDLSIVIQFKVQTAYSGILYTIETDTGNIININWDGSYITISSTYGGDIPSFTWTPYTVSGDNKIMTATCIPSDRSDEDDNIVYKYLWDDNTVWDDNSVWKDFVPVENVFYTLVINNGIATISKIEGEVGNNE